MTYEEQYAKALAKLAKRENAIMKKRFGGGRMESAMLPDRYKVGGAKGAAVRNAKQKECKA